MASDSYSDNVEHAVNMLNECLRRDPVAMAQMFNVRVACNDELASYSGVRVGIYDDVRKIGMLAILNGALGFKGPVIGAEGMIDPKTRRFIQINKFVDARKGVNLKA
ncbi:MAG: hypothetical protein GY804_06485 [Alphaproteobacteria bacterium]|nr:hypothetical protein [Alphaproteobacteria bacterium]